MERKKKSLHREQKLERSHDPSLLVGLNRSESRRRFYINLDFNKFYGLDSWTAYELSWLDKNGLPKNGILYFSDTGNRLLRRINENGKIETIAGDHSRKATFEDHTNQNGVARIIMPMNIRFYNNNVLLISDHFNHQIHAINVDM